MNSWERFHSVRRLKQASLLTIHFYLVSLHLIDLYNEWPSFMQKNLIFPFLGGRNICILFFATLSKQKHRVSRIQQKYSRKKCYWDLIFSSNFWFYADNLCTVLNMCVSIYCFYPEDIIKVFDYHNAKNQVISLVYTLKYFIHIVLLLSNKIVPIYIILISELIRNYIF